MEIPSLATDRILICTRFRERYITGVGEAVLQVFVRIYKQNSPTFKNYYTPFRYVSSVKTKIQGRIREGERQVFLFD